MTRETAPEMIRIAAVLREHEEFLTANKVFGIAGIIDYIAQPGYGHRYDADNPLPALAARIGRIGSHTAGVYRRNRNTQAVYEVSEDRSRTGNLLLDIANTIDSLMTGGEPVGAVRA